MIAILLGQWTAILLMAAYKAAPDIVPKPHWHKLMTLRWSW